MALGLRLYALTRHDLQFDEVFSIIPVRPHELFGLAADYMNSRPLFIYNLFINYWQAFGSGAFILRLPSALFGTAACLMMYLLAKETFDRETGFISAFLLAASSFYLNYSQECTPYALVVLLIITSFYGFMKWLRSGDKAALIISLVANLTGVYLIYFYSVVIFMQVVAVIAVRKSLKSNFRFWLISQAAGVLFLIPWFYICAGELARIVGLKQAAAPDYSITPYNTSVSAVNLLYSLLNFSTGYYAPEFLRFSGFLGMAALGLYGAALVLRSSRKKFFMLIWFMAFPAVCLWFVSGFAAVYTDRYVFPEMVFFFIFTAYGARGLFVKNRFAGCAALGVLAAIQVFSLSGYYGNRDCVPLPQRVGVDSRKQFRQAVEHLRERFLPGDLLVHLSEISVLPAEYYFHFDEHGVPGRRRRPGLISMAGFAGFVDDYFFTYKRYPKAVVHDIEKHAVFMHLFKPDFKKRRSVAWPRGKDCRRIWIIAAAWDGTGSVEGLWRGFYPFISQDFTLRGVQDFQDIKLSLYEKNRSD